MQRVAVRRRWRRRRTKKARTSKHCFIEIDRTHQNRHRRRTEFEIGNFDALQRIPAHNFHDIRCNIHHTFMNEAQLPTTEIHAVLAFKSSESWNCAHLHFWIQMKRELNMKYCLSSGTHSEAHQQVPVNQNCRRYFNHAAVVGGAWKKMICFCLNADTTRSESFFVDKKCVMNEMNNSSVFPPNKNIFTVLS